MNKIEINSRYIKKTAQELGADLCGIAPVERFTDAPKNFHPRDVLPECKSVVVLACRFPEAALNSESGIYTLVRNQMAKIMDTIAFALSKDLESKGFIAFPKKSMGPCRWDEESGRYRDIISLKHAAVLAGLGKIGKNTLLVNKKYGNMLWLSAVLVSLEIEPDTLVDYEVCNPLCNRCIVACPVNALGDEYMKQMICYNHAYTTVHEEEQILCHTCRKVCPNCLGIGNKPASV